MTPEIKAAAERLQKCIDGDFSRATLRDVYGVEGEPLFKLREDRAVLADWAVPLVSRLDKAAAELHAITEAGIAAGLDIRHREGVGGFTVLGMIQELVRQRDELRVRWDTILTVVRPKREREPDAGWMDWGCADGTLRFLRGSD